MSPIKVCPTPSNTVLAFIEGRPKSIFNYIDEAFHVSRPIDSEIVQFSSSLSNYKPLQINVLRLSVKCLLLNQDPAHMVLFLIGPGHTGKSTLANMLISLKESTCCTLDLPNLSDKFGIDGLLGANFAVFPDVDPEGLTSKRASALKSISGGGQDNCRSQIPETSALQVPRKRFNAR